MSEMVGGSEGPWTSLHPATQPSSVSLLHVAGLERSLEPGIGIVKVGRRWLCSM